MASKDLDQIQLGSLQKPALLVVDMINGFTDPECPLGTHCPGVIAANCQLLAAFRQKSLPIFFTTVVYHNDQQARVFRAKVPALNVLKVDSHWVKVDSRLGRSVSEPLIEKQWASAFYQTDLDWQLKSLSVNSLIITGLTTSGCVRASAVDALQHNYQVVIAEEGVGDRNLQAHKANLFDLNAKYADVRSLTHVVASL
tara:strand:- start:496 stop:1089 length:594 start_codon:yes stop_codon:yes gene_type:complete